MNPGPILIGLPGTELDDKSLAQLRHPAVGGVVLFTRNYANRNQLERLVADIRPRDRCAPFDAGEAGSSSTRTRPDRRIPPRVYAGARPR